MWFGIAAATECSITQRRRGVSLLPADPTSRYLAERPARSSSRLKSKCRDEGRTVIFPLRTRPFCMRTVAVVIERADDGHFGAHVPDLPGCAAAGETLDEVLELIGGAIELYLDDMRQEGEAIPDQFAVAYNITLKTDAA